KRVFRFSLDDIAKGEPVECVCNEATPPRLTGVEVLRLAFTNPGALKPTLTAEYVTAEASSGIAKIAESMRNRGVEPHQAAHCPMAVVFCLGAADIGRRPESVFSRTVRNGRGDSDRLLRSMTELFAAMKDGGDCGADDIPWFNGGLFDGTGAIEMTEGEID